MMMKSYSRYSGRSNFSEKFEIVNLQKENAALRLQLKELGKRLNDLIELRDVQKSRAKVSKADPEGELKEVKKMIELYKKEKESLAKRLAKVLDLNYLNTLTVKVAKYQQMLNECQLSKKNADLSEKKENHYKNSPTKAPEPGSEFDYLNVKRQDYIQKIKHLEGVLTAKQKAINDSSKKSESLEKEQQRLINELGDSYSKMKSLKKIQKEKSKQEKIHHMLTKETNSKVNAMSIKIKSLQNELKMLKDNEEHVNSQFFETVKKVDMYQEKIRYSPVYKQTKRAPEQRSNSTKPNIKHLFYTDLANSHLY